jgi:hypothetical protein
MRVFSLRRSAVLALSGVLLGGLLGGCGKGTSSNSSSDVSRSTALTAHGALGVSTKNTTRLGGPDAASNAAAVAAAVYPGLTAATRPQAVVLVDEHNWPASLAASALASAPLGAPLLYTDGGELPAASSQALGAMRPIGATALGGAQVIRIGATTAAPSGYRTHTVAISADPASTAAAIEGLFRIVHGHAPRQVIVLAAQAPRALQMPATALAAESATPILLLDATGVPPATTAVLKGLHRPTIYVVGAAVVPKQVLGELGRLGSVVRVAGNPDTGDPLSAGESSNPVENAISVARFQHGSFGWGVHEAGHGLVFANATNPLDAPASASLSAHGDYAPLLLLESSATVPPALAHYLSNIEPGYTTAIPPVRSVYNHGWLIGDEHAISALAQAEIDAVLEIAPRNPSAAEESVASAE